MICTGIFSSYKLPEFEGKDQFKGKIIHSMEFGKYSENLKNKKILVVGGSFSALEIASKLSQSGNDVIHSFNKPCWILQKFLPVNPNNVDQGVLPLDVLFYTRRFYQQAFQQNIQKQEDKSFGYIRRNTNLSNFCKFQQTQPELQIKQEEFFNPQNQSISEDYQNLIIEKKILPIRSKISKYNPQNDEIQFENQTKIENVDLIIFSTGFNVQISFLDKKILETIKFDENDNMQTFINYKTILHPDLRGLFFIAMYKGPYFAIMELQSKYSLELIKKECNYPSKEEFQKGLQEEIDIRNQRPRLKFPHIDFVKFADDIAMLRNKKFPNVQKLYEANESEQFIEALNLNLGQLEKWSEKLKVKEFQEEIKKLFFEDFVTADDYNITENFEQFIQSKKEVLKYIVQSKQENIDFYKNQKQNQAVL